MTALASPWLAPVQAEKTVNLKEWNENYIFITYPEKQTNSNHYTTATTIKKRTHILISAEKLAHSWHFRAILSTLA